MDDILEVTQKIFKDPAIQVKQKSQIWKGLRYIQDERQTKYQALCWLVKWFAALWGVEARLKEENDAIDLLKDEAGFGLGLPLLKSKVTRVKSQPVLQLEEIESQLVELGEKRPHDVTEIDAWYEEFFFWEKRLFDWRQKSSDEVLRSALPQLQALEEKLDVWNGKMPRVTRLFEGFGDSFLKDTLRASFEALNKEHKFSSTEKEKDEALYLCSTLEAYALFAKRLIKSERTKLPLSLVTAIERTWEELLQGRQKKRENAIA